MIKKRAVKVIKRQESKAGERRDGATEFSGGSNIWSRSVRLWVDQYRQASAKRLPEFDRLFKDSQPIRAPSSTQ